MALRGASTVTVDRDWVEFKELARENAAVLFTVNEIEAEEKFTNSTFSPVRARVAILTGSQAGEVYPDERILAAGVRLKLAEAGVGAHVVGRIQPYGSRKHPGLEAEEAGDLALAEKALAKLEGSSSEAPARSKAKTVKAEDSEPPF